ncbi:MAG: metallophosphoesterase family protein [Candidatus Hydrogenedentes bacterium]|nr:metallophosphoesterase family protein [Candidatus Hydrogenedentota bacterium]
MNQLFRCSRVLLVALFLVFGLAVAAEPLHIYLTYSDAPETSIDVNIVMPRASDTLELHFDTAPHAEPGEYANRVRPQYVQTPMELSDRRTMYVAALKDLAPGTVYHFMTTDEDTGPSAPRSFRTLPGGNAPLRIVNGGDMAVDGNAIPLLTLAGKQDPDFAVIGGDIAYVNGLLGGFATWDLWLKNWSELMVTSDGRMIPLVCAIGNHETNRYNTEDIALRAPWYMSLFGRQAGDLYYSRKFGDNLILFVLDSGHLRPHAGAQTDWLAAEMEKYKDVKYKFAAYHVPLYPAHRPYEGEGSAQGRVHWGPLFDQFGLTVGLEHHDHVLKRTKPLKGGQVVEQGTIYIGDGTFGRGARTVDPEPRWYNQVEAAAQHFWVIDVADDKLSFKAIDPEGAVLDEFTLP